jgi:hypothetical protein
MNIIPKDITTTNTIVNTVNFKLSKLNDLHITNDDPIRKVLRVNLVEAVPPQTLVIKDAEYDSLGQWTDDSLLTYIINKYGIQVIPPIVTGSVDNTQTGSI